VNEDPMQANHRTHDLRQVAGSQLGWLQLSAMGNVRIDGQSPKQGVFAATADRASYTQIKEQFILEGSGRVPATLWHRNPVTGQQIDNSAAKITYNRITGEAVWDGFQSIELTPGAGAGGAIKSAIGPGAVRQ
jgi:hypothetical protein